MGCARPRGLGIPAPLVAVSSGVCSPFVADAQGPEPRLLSCSVSGGCFWPRGVSC